MQNPIVISLGAREELATEGRFEDKVKEEEEIEWALCRAIGGFYSLLLSLIRSLLLGVRKNISSIIFL